MPMRAHKTVILLTLGFLIGISVLLYPAFSNYWNSKTQSRAIVNYESVLEYLEPEDYSAVYQSNASCFSKKSVSEIVRIPSSSCHGTTGAFCIKIRLKPSPILRKDCVSCLLLSCSIENFCKDTTFFSINQKIWHFFIKISQYFKDRFAALPLIRTSSPLASRLLLFCEQGSIQ